MDAAQPTPERGILARVLEQSRRPLIRNVALVLLIIAAFVLPRVVALRGIQATSSLWNVDMVNHLKSADLRFHKPFFAAEHAHHFTQEKVVRWPPGLFSVAQLWIGSHGTWSIWTTQLTNLIFSIVMILGVVALGASIAGLRVGLWSALLVVLCPALVAHSWYFSIDYPLIGLVTVGIVLLWQTKGFTRWPICLLLVGWSVLGMLFKPTYALYLFPPSIWVLVEGLSCSKTRLRALAFCSLSAALTLSVTVWSQDMDSSAVLLDFQQHLAPAPGDPTFESIAIEPWSARSLVAYAEFMFTNYPFPLLLLALPGLVLLHTRRGRQLRARGMLLCFVWGTYAVLTVLACKQERYVQVLYPTLCVITVLSVVRHVPRRWQLTALVWLVAAYAAVLYVCHRHPTPWVMRKATRATWDYHYILPMPGHERLSRMRSVAYHDWQCDIDGVVDKLAELSRRSGDRLVGLLDDRLGDRYQVMMERIRLAAQHRLKKRGIDSYLVRVGPWHWHLVRNGPAYRDRIPSSLIVVHRRGAVAPSLQSSRAVVRLEQELTCSEDRLHLVLTLVKRRKRP